MTQLDINLTLPDDLAREAEAQGLLVPEALERLIRAELGRRRHQGLREMLDQLASLDTPR
jgi:post-segregation antitoxin (ccd killing protein)